MKTTIKSLLSIALVTALFACGSSGDDKSTNSPPPEEESTVDDAAEEEEEQSYSDFIRETDKKASDDAHKCLDEHLNKIDLEAFRSGEMRKKLESGEMSDQFSKMEKACRSSIDPLYRKKDRWAIKDHRLDKAIFSALHFRDAYTRVDLYIKRVGESKKKKIKENVKKLEAALEEAKSSAADLKAAVKSLDGVDLEGTGGRAKARTVFLERFAERFETYLEGPVKKKRAIYHGISKFLSSGLHQMGKQRKTSKAFRDAVAALYKEYKMHVTVLEDYLTASKSKKKRSKKIKSLVDAALSQL